MLVRMTGSRAAGSTGSMQQFGVAVGVVTVAAAAFLLVVGHEVPALAVTIAGALLVTFMTVLGRWVVPARQGALSAADRRRNLAAVRIIAHVFAVTGVVVLAVGAVLTLTGVGDPDVARLLLVWMGPYTLVAALGMYTGRAVARRDARPSDQT